MSDCVFCEIVAGKTPAKIIADGISSIAIEPLGPQATPGHFLVIPRRHVTDVIDDPDVAAQTMHDAALWTGLRARRDQQYTAVQFITSTTQHGSPAVAHLRIHVIPQPITTHNTETEYPEMEYIELQDITAKTEPHQPVKVYDICDHENCDAPTITTPDYQTCENAFVGYACNTCCYDKGGHMKENCPHDLKHNTTTQTQYCPTKQKVTNV